MQTTAIHATDLFPTTAEFDARERRAADIRAWKARLDAVIARCERRDGGLSLDDAKREMVALYAEARRLGL